MQCEEGAWYSLGAMLNIRRAVLACALSLSCALAPGQASPQELQSRGIARLDAVIEQGRRDGPQIPMLSEYDAVAKDLEQSYHGFVAASNFKQGEKAVFIRQER